MASLANKLHPWPFQGFPEGCDGVLLIFLILNCDKIYTHKAFHLYLFKVYSSGELRCSHYYATITTTISRTFVPSHMEAPYPVNPGSSPPLPPVPAIPLTNMSALGPSCNRNPTRVVLLHLVYFTQHNVLKVRACCSLCHNFLPF